MKPRSRTAQWHLLLWEAVAVQPLGERGETPSVALPALFGSAQRKAGEGNERAETMWEGEIWATVSVSELQLWEET